MTAEEFVLGIESEWMPYANEEQSNRLLWQIARFDEKQLERIFDQLLRDCKSRPRIAHIYDAAETLGVMPRKSGPSKSRKHTWEKTDCQLCEGEGRISVFFEMLIQRTETGIEMDPRLVAIQPYSAYPGKHELQRGEYLFVYRCSCPAGDAEGLPSGWLRWTGERPAQNWRPDEEKPPSRAEMQSVRQLVTDFRSQPEKRVDQEEVPF